MLTAFTIYFFMGMKILRGEYVSGTIDFEKEKLKKETVKKEAS